MRNRFVVVFALLLSAVVGQLQAQNLLTNPSFENFAGNLLVTSGVRVLNGWRYFSVTGASLTLQSVNDTHQGNIAAKMTRSNVSGDAGLDRDGALLVPVTQGHTYVASIWAKGVGNCSMMLTLAPYNSSRAWIGVQKNQTYSLTPQYKKYTISYTIPSGAPYANFAIRVAGTGTMIVDDCSMVDLSVAPPSPTVTYPSNETVDSFKPAIAFAGYPHTGYQAIITNGGTTVWDSGVVSSPGFSTSCPVTLQQSSAYQVQVRLQNSAGWGTYCTPVSFTTPAAPLVKILSPREADSVRGPGVTVKWRAEAPGGITSQSVRIDNGPVIPVDPAVQSYGIDNLGEGVHSVAVSVTSPEGTAQDTSRFYTRITPAPSGTLYFYDMSYVLNYDRTDPFQNKLAYDIATAVTSLQGLVNRKGVRLFVRLRSVDDTWFNRMRESGNWLSNKNIVTLPTGFENLATLFETFKDDFKGAVLWDPNVNATVNVANTVNGADDLISVRYDPAPGTVYNALIASGPRIPVQVDLTDKFTGTGTIWQTELPSTGSKKCDAYVWARAKYLETGKCNSNLLFYGCDAYWLKNDGQGSMSNYIANRDYIIRNKGFSFDLNIWGDEVPIDDKTQPVGTDLNTLKSIFSVCAARTPGMVEMVGFVPWPVKYTTRGGAGGTLHDPVPSEWELVTLCSLYNIYVDADALAYNWELPNASIYSQFPLPDRLTQNRKFSPTELRKLGYLDKSNVISPLNFLNIYMGDYDSASWVGRWGDINWTDWARGTLPMSWAFNPNLSKRVPALFEYYYRTRTDNDFFIAGDSGAGYVNPTLLISNRTSGLPSARDIWISHCLDYYRRNNVKITGFILNGNAGPVDSAVDNMYAQFSPNGTFTQPFWIPQGEHMAGTMPAMVQQSDLDLPNGPAPADNIQPRGTVLVPQFLNFRSVVWPPSWVKYMFDDIVARDTSIPWALIDAETYAALSSCYMGVVPDGRATYTFDTIPSCVYAGGVLNPSIGVRNDGWETWKSSDFRAVTLVLKWMKGEQVISSVSVPLPRDVASGEGVVLDLATTPPAQPGEYTLHYEMVRDGIAFTSIGDYSWENKVTVVPVGGTTASAKSQQDGTPVTIADAVVTAGTDQFASAFYIEDKERCSGIKITTGTSSNTVASEGDSVSVTGTMSTDNTGERIITNPVLLFQQPGSWLRPLGMAGRWVGGSDLNQFTPGFSNKPGLYNTGLLITVWGRVKRVDNTYRYFYIDDGTGSIDGSGEPGVCVDCSGLATGNSIDMPEQGEFVVVTGISSAASVDTHIVPAVRVRKQVDIRPL